MQSTFSSPIDDSMPQPSAGAGKSALTHLGLLLLTLGTALALTGVSAADPSTERNKVWLMGSGVALLIAAQRRPSLSWLGIGLTLSLVLSSALALDPQQAVFGGLERNFGLLSCLFLLLLSGLSVSWPQVRTYLLCASCLLSCWALLQALQWESALGLIWHGAEATRVFAGLGNPNNLGNWLALTLPILLSQAIQGTPRSRWIYALASALSLTALGLTQTRGAWLGLIAAALFAVWRWRGSKRPMLMLGLSGALLASLVLALSLMSHRSASVKERVDLWRDSASAIVAADPARLLFGHGLDTQAPAISAQRQLRSAVQAGIMLDRAHNLLLDSLLTIGLIPTALLCWLLYLRWSAVKNSVDRQAALLSALLAWQVGFPLAAEATVFVLILTARDAPMPRNKPAHAAFNWVAGSFCWVLSWTAFAPSEWQPMLSQPSAHWRRPEAALAAFRRGQLAWQQSNFALAHEEFQKASQLSPSRIDFHRATLAKP